MTTRHAHTSTPAHTHTGEAAGIVVQSVTKRYGDLLAVNNVSLDVPAGSLVALLGPSGCGKTTLLRLVGGFETPDAGQITVGGRDVTRLPPQQRPSAMVFQSYALFPTMTVGENVEYGLRVRKVPRSERRPRVAEALGRVELDGLEAKPVTQLSGGQQQRVALARALAVAPAVLLFDEPLSNLDQALREATRRQLKTLLPDLGTTSLYVTHDQQEALALADQIAVMQSGRIVEVGAPEALYRKPRTAYVARFLGGSNVVEDPRLAERFAGEAVPPGCVLAVRPEHLRLVDGATPLAVPVQVRSRQFLGTYSEWEVETEGSMLRLWLDPDVTVPETVAIAAERWRWVDET
ncbi:MAG: ABC transporter ATP-binding protein [Bacteroidota bacterium]